MPEAAQAAPESGSGNEPSIPERVGAILDLEAPKPERQEPERAPEAAPKNTAPERDSGDAAPETVSGETEDAEAEPETVIAPPANWKADLKAKWNTLPPDLQRDLAQQEAERNRGFGKRLEEIAAREKATEAEIAAAKQERQQYARHLEQLIPALHQQIAGEFADIKTAADLEKLANADPSRFVKWQAKQTALASARAQQDAVNRQIEGERQEKFKTWVAEQEKILQAEIPEWGKDIEAGKKEIEQIRSHLISRGIPEKDAQAMADANLILIARDAMLYRQAKAKAAAAEKAPVAPKPLKSGPPQTQTSEDERAAALQQQLRKTGDVRVAAKLFERFL